MSRKQQIFEDVLQGAYSFDKFARFSRELFAVGAQKPPQNFSERQRQVILSCSLKGG